MKDIKLFTYRYILFALLAAIIYAQPTHAQEALSSVHVNIQNIRLSGDQKTISYDVYFQSVNADTAVALAAYLFRLSVPLSEVGSNEKTLTATNIASAIGVRGIQMTTTPTSSPTHWLMKCQNSVLVSSYESALQLPKTFPGVRIATLNISNTDGSTFANPQNFTATYAGDLPLVKTSISIFKPNTTTLSASANTAQPIENFFGLGLFSLSANKVQLTASDPSVTLHKVYNGSTSAAVTPGTLSGVESSDAANVVLNATANYDNASVGSGKTITVNYSLSGSAIGNYSAPVSKTYTTGDITAAPLTITGVTASDKVYNGNTTASLTGGALTGVLGSDVVTLTSGTGAFSDKNIGSGKTVTATGYSIGGANAANYSLSAQPSGLSASITTAPLSITGVAASNKVYDGTTTASLTGGTLTGVLGSDVVTITPGVGAFSDKNIGGGKTVTATGYSLGGAGAANYLLSAQPSGLSATITAAPLTITGVTASNKVYDGTTTATLTGGTLTGIIGSDVVSLTSGSGVFSTKNTGSGKAITASGYSIGGAGAANYTLSAQPTGLTANITEAPLTISGVTASDKVYNGNTTASLTGGTLTGVLGSDVVTITPGVGAFSDKNIGGGKTVTATGYSLGGAGAANYLLSTQPSGLSATITAAPLSITGVTASNKVYNGTTTASLTGGTLTGVLGSDVVTITPGVGAFSDKNIGGGKTVTATGYSLGGAGAANYLLSAQPSGLSATITAAPLTITGVTASNKIYNGTTTASLTGGTLTGVLGSDVVTITPGVGAFSDKNTGGGKTVTATGYSLGGAGAANYLLSAQPSGLSATITTAPLTITGVTASNKVYDGVTTTSLTGGTLTGVLGSDVVTITPGVGKFSDKNIGSGKTVTATGYSLSGAGAANYALSAQPGGLSATITTAPLTITGVTASNKVYDGNTTATLSGGSLVGVAIGDDVSLVPGTGTFADKNIGIGTTVTATGYSISGADASNYTLSSQPTGLTASITSFSSTLTITGITVSNKVYDGTTKATLSGGTLVGVAAGDNVTLVLGTGAFADKNIGTNKTVTASGYSLSGTDAINYSLTPPSGLAATITAAPLTITGVTASNKVYDGVTTTSLTGGTLTGVLGSDVVTITPGVGKFSDKNIGSGKTVTATGYSLSGAGAANYALSAQPGGLSATITTAPLTITGVTASNKVYDGNTTATLSGGTLVGVAIGDDVSLVPGTGTFADKNIAIDKPVTVSGYSISGADASNYTLSSQPTGLTASITSFSSTLTITGITVSNKVYDGTTKATLSGGTLVGVAAGDNVTLVLGTGAFADKNAGTNKTVTASGYSLSGTDASSYTLGSQPSGLTATITPAPLEISGVTAMNKVYDGTNAASLTGGTLTGVLGNDVVTLSSITGSFVDRNAGSGKSVLLSNYALVGADSANYSLTKLANSLSASILPLELKTTPPNIVLSKKYDGTTSASVTKGTLVGVLACDNDSVNLYASATYNDEKLGVGKTISVSNFLTGAAAKNYISPVDYVVTNGEILSETIRINPLETPSAGCENTDMILDYTVLTGYPTLYKITFSEEALAAGINNIPYTALATTSSGSINLPIPQKMVAGNYQGTLQLKDEFGAESALYTFSFTINLSSDYIIPKFDDVIIFNNAEKSYVSYQWYKDGALIKGATNQFYNDPAGLVGSYSVKVTNTAGQTLFTCEKVLNVALAKKSIVCPNPININQACSVELKGFNESDLDGAMLSVHDTQGHCIHKTTQVENLNTFKLPAISQIYFGRVTLANGSVYDFKIIVGKK